MADNSDVRLYGVPGAEVLYLTAAEVYESDIDPWLDDDDPHKPRQIEEWSVAPPRHGMPSAVTIIEDITERVGDDWLPDEWAYAAMERAGKAPEVVAAFDAALDLLASKFDYKVADKCLTTHTVTWNDEGEPLLDGEPMYVKKAAV